MSGDHAIVTGVVEHADIRSGEPLLYFGAPLWNLYRLDRCGDVFRSPQIESQKIARQPTASVCAGDPPHEICRAYTRAPYILWHTPGS